MIRIVRLSLKPEFRERFLKLFHERMILIKSSRGCQQLEIWEDLSDNAVFYTYSLWDSSDDLEQYRMSDLFNDTWSTIKPWFKEKPQAHSAVKHITV